jgi:hypothetical protein
MIRLEPSYLLISAESTPRTFSNRPPSIEASTANTNLNALHFTASGGGPKAVLGSHGGSKKTRQQAEDGARRQQAIRRGRIRTNQNWTADRQRYAAGIVSEEARVWKQRSPRSRKSDRRRRGPGVFSAPSKGNGRFGPQFNHYLRSPEFNWPASKPVGRGFMFRLGRPATAHRQRNTVPAGPSISRSLPGAPV